MRLLVPLAMATCAALATPIDTPNVHLINAPSPNQAPLCGYVAIRETDWWSVGLESKGFCEPIWKGEAAAKYRIDRDKCGCGFFLTEEDCKGKGDMVLHRGPKLEETRFEEDKKPTWVLCQSLQG